MLHIAYYEAEIASFCKASDYEILGALAEHHGFALEIQQRLAWQEQIRLMQISLASIDTGLIFFEFSIPRMGKRADVVLLIGSAIFIVEFKVGSDTFDRAALEQVHDYALDLKNFHRGSHHHPILPILIATQAPCQTVDSIEWASDGVAQPIGVSPSDLCALIS